MTQRVERRVYLYIDQLAELTPWSPQRIRNMILEGEFLEGVHFFRPKTARRSRPIFVWQAVVEYIEATTARTATLAQPAVDEATRAVHALLD